MLGSSSALGGGYSPQQVPTWYSANEGALLVLTRPRSRAGGHRDISSWLDGSDLVQQLLIPIALFALVRDR